MLLPSPAVESQTSQAIESREAQTMPFHLEVKVHIERKTQEIEDEKLHGTRGENAARGAVLALRRALLAVLAAPAEEKLK